MLIELSRIGRTLTIRRIVFTTFKDAFLKKRTAIMFEEGPVDLTRLRVFMLTEMISVNNILTGREDKQSIREINEAKAESSFEQRVWKSDRQCA